MTSALTLICFLKKYQFGLLLKVTTTINRNGLCVLQTWELRICRPQWQTKG